MIPLIGLSGYARSGKDTAAAALIEAGWERRAFADTLREFLYAVNPVIPIKGKPYRLARLVDAYGWEAVKVAHDEVRELLQRLGTDAGRKILGENVWVTATLAGITQPTVVTDVRFPNEADAVRARGGLVVRVLREGTGPVNGHVSETALDDYDFDTYLVNVATVRDLQQSIVKIATEWKDS